MVTLFKTVLGMSATGAGVILLVLLARLALGRAPKHFSYALWVVVTAVIAVIALGAALATNRASRPPAPETTLHDPARQPVAEEGGVLGEVEEGLNVGIPIPLHIGAAQAGHPDAAVSVIAQLHLLHGGDGERDGNPERLQILGRRRSPGAEKP